MAVGVFRYIFARFIFLALVLLLINFYAPIAGCSKGSMASVLETIREGNARIAEIFDQATRRMR